MKIFLISFSLIMINFSFAQSKIDTAKKKLEEAKEKKSEKKSNSSESNSNDDSDDDSSIFSAIDYFVTPLSFVSSITFNHDLYHDEDLIIEHKKYGYNPYPFSNNTYQGIQNPNSDRMWLSSGKASYGFNGGDKLESLSLKYNFNFYGWKVFADYNFISEKDASENLQKFGAYIQRKSLFLDYIDIGLNLGYSIYSIGSSQYQGLNLGFTANLFLLKPISLDYATNVTFYSGEKLFSSEYTLNYHFSNYLILSKYHHIDILGVTFNTMHFGIGLYF